MICKKDVIQWFKELESYKRIDTMCTLLNMCLPFELRFLGTCLEELGRRDSQKLRGMELRVNSPQDLAADMVACQKGEPTDKKIRRKMALYLALIRACNRNCVAEIFRTLDGWGERDFLSMNDPDTLQELLLVYTMAANHPVFSFEQHLKCTEIFDKIKENKLVYDQFQYQQQMQNIEQTMAHGQHQLDLRQHMPPSHQELLSQQTLHAMHLTGQHPHTQLTGAPIQMISQAMSFPQAHLTKLIPGDGSIHSQVPVDGILHVISPNITIPADSTTMLPHPNATWTLRPYPQPGPSMEHPPQSSSPMLSQQSSPSSSRTTSPNRTPINNMMQQQAIQTQQQVRNIPQRIGTSLKNVRRPSAETTPPPMSQQQHQIISNENLAQNKHIDEVGLSNDGSGNQLQTLIRNGFCRPGHPPRSKGAIYISPQQQSPYSQLFPVMPGGNFTSGLPYAMQNITISEGTGAGQHNMDSSLMCINSNKSAGSDSASPIDSSGEISPPETPTGSHRMNSGDQQQQKQKHHQQQISYNKTINHARLNGRTEKLHTSCVSGVTGVTGSTIVYAQSATLANSPHQPLTQQQSQQLFGTDIILAPGGNAGGSNLMQTTLANNNNNNSGGAINNIATVNSTVNNASTNNNMASNALLISSSSAAAASGGLIGNMITSNSVLVQAPHQQYNTYPYHAAAAQHLASTSRPPIMTHNSSMGPPPPGAFRLPGFQLAPNSEVLYPAYHSAGIAFLSGGAPPGASPVTLRSSNTVSVSANTTAGVPQPPQLQQGTPQHLQQQQLVQSPAVSNALLTAPQYSNLTVGVNKPLSCYNCGSQTHSGRDCQEASMDDVTSSAVYKLDYSVSASSNVSPTTSSGSNIGTSVGSGSGSGNSIVSEPMQAQHHQKQQQHAIESGIAGPTSSTPTSATSSLPPPTVAGTINTI